MRLTAQVQPNKSSSKHRSRPTRDFDCVFGVSAILMFFGNRQPSRSVLFVFFWLSGKRQPDRSMCFFVLLCAFGVS